MGKIKEMPLFPLGTVLFPGMVLPLHIFEPRYTGMIGECIDSNQPFGVVLIKDGFEVGEGAQPYLVGTSAYVTHVEKLADGRMNIQSVGYQRFRVHDLHNNKPYLSGIVEDLPIGKVDDPEVQLLSTQFMPVFRTYLETLLSSTDLELEVQEYPDDPLALAIFAAVTMAIPADDKQALLATENLDDILRLEIQLIKRESVLLEQMLQDRRRDPNLPFSMN